MGSHPFSIGLGRNTLALFFVLCLVVLPSILSADSGSDAPAAGFLENWQARYNGPGDENDYATAFTVDGAGNVYITGFSDGGSSTNDDFATCKFSSDGQMDWVSRYDSVAHLDDTANAIVVDDTGSVIVSGRVDGGIVTLDDCATVKYNSSGQSQWAKRYNGAASGDDWAEAVCLDAAGDVIVVGGTTGVGGSGQNMLTFKRDITSGTLAWSATYNNAANNSDFATAVAADGAGNVYVGGATDTGFNGLDYVLVKYNSAGQEQWVRTYSGTGFSDDKIAAVVVDDNGDVYVTGEAFGSFTASDFVTIKYNDAGTVLWSRRYSTSGAYADKGRTMVVDSSFNLYVAGYVTVPALGTDLVVLKYNSVGDLVWEESYSFGRGYEDEPSALTLDDEGHLYAAGFSWSETTMFDWVALQYDDDGNRLWSARWDYTPHERDVPVGLGLDNEGNLYVGGYSYGGSGPKMDYAVVQYCAGCVIAQSCIADGAQNPSNPCLICDAAADRTDWTDNNGQSCDDGLFCNGNDLCLSGTCSFHSGDPCLDDGMYCNGTEYCDQTAGACLHTGNPCPDDGLYCNGFESCDEGRDACQNTGDPCPDDDILCNGEEFCDETNDLCKHTGDPCEDDGLYCNGVEYCDTELDYCVSSGDPCPDDEIFCNGKESCDETSDRCLQSGDPCTDDGLYCNGEEFCDETNGQCAHGGSPCEDDEIFCNGDEKCDENQDQCISSGNPCPQGDQCLEDYKQCLSQCDDSDCPQGDDDEDGGGSGCCGC